MAPRSVLRLHGILTDGAQSSRRRGRAGNASRLPITASKIPEVKVKRLAELGGFRYTMLLSEQLVAQETDVPAEKA